MCKYKRILTEDDEELVLAIKQGENDLLTNFQEYWKERCGNPEYLLKGDVYITLSNFAVKNFLKSDWYGYQERIKSKLFWKENIDCDVMNEFLLQTILGMQMYYDKPITDCCKTIPFTTTNTKEYYNKMALE